MDADNHDKQDLKSHSSNQSITLTASSSQPTKHPRSPVSTKTPQDSHARQKSSDKKNLRRGSDSGSEANVNHGFHSTLNQIKDTLEETNMTGHG